MSSNKPDSTQAGKVVPFARAKLTEEQFIDQWDDCVDQITALHAESLALQAEYARAKKRNRVAMNRKVNRLAAIALQTKHWT